jgi:probable HAF family extracellular repeat protein
MERRAGVWFVFVAILILALGCGGSGGGSSTTTSSTGTTGSTGQGFPINASQGGYAKSGNALVVIPPNALAQNTTIFVQPAPGTLAPPPKNNTILGATAYDLSPNGLQFSTPATLTITYSPTSIPTGVPETSLEIYTEASGAWQVVDGSTVNTTAHSISVPLAHFSVYAVISPSFVGTGPIYTVTDLGVLPGDAGSTPSGISSNGQVCGVSVSAAGALHAFLWANGTMTNLGARPGDIDAKAQGVNASGAAVGTSLPDTKDAYPVEFVGGAVTQLNTQFGMIEGIATAINDSGEIILGNELNVGNTITPFPTGFTPASGSCAINVSAQVAGSVGNDAAVWAAGKVTDDGILPGYDVSAGTAISDNGQLVGTANSNATNDPVGFILTGGTMTKISPVPGGTTPDNIALPVGVNNAGQVVGTSSQSFITARAFLYQNGVTQDLNALVPSSTAWTLRQAYGINNAGQIIVLGVSTEGAEHALLLNPINPPARRSSATKRR